MSKGEKRVATFLKVFRIVLPIVLAILLIITFVNWTKLIKKTDSLFRAQLDDFVANLRTDTKDMPEWEIDALDLEAFQILYSAKQTIKASRYNSNDNIHEVLAELEDALNHGDLAWMRDNNGLLDAIGLFADIPDSTRDAQTILRVLDTHKGFR